MRRTSEVCFEVYERLEQGSSHYIPCGDKREVRLVPSGSAIVGEDEPGPVGANWQ